jgi:DNA-binding NtrC family response regulator
MYASKSSRILVVEDDALLAWELQDILSGHGYEVLGPISRLSILLRHLRKILPEAASEPAIDAAILDVTIDGGLVFPAADMLARANVPFAFVSGHARQMLPELHRQRPLLNKPICPDDVLSIVAELIETLEGPASGDIGGAIPPREGRVAAKRPAGERPATNAASPHPRTSRRPSR